MCQPIPLIKEEQIIHAVNQMSFYDYWKQLVSICYEITGFDICIAVGGC